MDTFLGDDGVYHYAYVDEAGVLRELWLGVNGVWNQGFQVAGCVSLSPVKFLQVAGVWNVRAIKPDGTTLGLYYSDTGWQRNDA